MNSRAERTIQAGEGSRQPRGLPPAYQRFLDFLESRSLKLTRQRRAVLDEVFADPGHFEAEDLVERLRNNPVRVSRATVYRTLELLQECGLVAKQDFGSPRAYYEHVAPGEHHDHLICTRSGNVIEFRNEELVHLLREICASHNFAYETHSLRIFGLSSRFRGAAPSTEAHPDADAALDLRETRERFERFLESRQLKLTRQRAAVFDAIFGAPGHLEAEDLVERLREAPVKVSRATVYRTLELLQECGLVDKLDFGASRAFYEHVYPGEHHDHLICTRTGAVVEFYSARLEGLQQQICENFDFEETHHSLRIFGESR